MRLFQNYGYAPSYGVRFEALASGAHNFTARRNAFLADRYGASHILRPVQDGREEAFFTNGSDPTLQAMWARENGLPDAASAADILLAQIEAHRTDVFYNLDPVRFDSAFVRRLPGCVRKTIAWRAVPAAIDDFGAYDLVVVNFPSVRAHWEAKGWRTAPFFPAHDPELDAYAANEDRPIDVIFFGGYSRHHTRRAAILRAVARLRQTHNVAMFLDRSRLIRVADTPLGLVPPLARHRRPRDVRAIAQPPLFGRALYDALSRAKIVLNGSADHEGPDRGNMRCWEATGARALLLSDRGLYPDTMREGVTMALYEGADDAVTQITRLLAEPAERARIADGGAAMIRARYGKDAQWEAFEALAG